MTSTQTTPILRMLALVLVALTVAAALAMTSAGDAQAKKNKKAKSYTRTSTVFEQRVYGETTQENNPLTDTPYAFGGTGKMSTLNNVSVTLTTAVQFPDDPGLVLGLDGIDTGIPITGLSDDPRNRTPITVKGSPQNQAQILQALKQDGQLVGTIIDRDRGDNIIFNEGGADTTLTIKGKLKK
jgi:hypothetical protein